MRKVDVVIITRDLKLAERAVLSAKETCADLIESVVLVMRSDVGCVAAQNQGWRATSTEYVLFLNDDAFLTRHCLERLIETLDANPQAAASGPTIPCRSHQGALPRAAKPKAVPAPFLIWSCVLVRRSAYEAVGLHDETFSIMDGDVDVGYRWRDAGWSLLWVRDAWCNHFVGATVNRVDQAAVAQIVERDNERFQARWGDRLQREAVGYLEAVE